MSEKRVNFDFEITFTNGGGLKGWDFRLDIEGDDISDESLAAYIIQDLRLLMAGDVAIHNKTILTEPHKRTPPSSIELSSKVIDLRDSPISLEGLFSEAAVATIRVVAPDGDSYIIRRAAE